MPDLTRERDWQNAVAELRTAAAERGLGAGDGW